MNKTKAIVKFCVIGIIVILGLVLCFAEFTIPFTTIRYSGCYNAIKDKMGIDLNGGIVAVYTASPNKNSTDFKTEMTATMNRISNTLTNKNYPEATVTRQGNNKIRIEVPGMENAEDIVEAIGTPANIEFMKPTSSQTTTYNADDIFMDGSGIKSVAVVSDPNDATYYSLKLTFTDEGTVQFRNMVSSAAGQYMTIFQNEEVLSAPRIDSDSANTLGADGTVLITGGTSSDGTYSGYDKESADRLALQIEAGLYSVSLSPSEMSYIPATLGEGAILAGGISLVVGLLFIFILMWFCYRDFGLLANLSLVIYTIIFLFLLAIIDAVQLTLPGIAGIILSIGMAVDANILIFEQIKEEYRSGKRFSAATHSGFNKSAITILDANVTTIIVSVILYLLSDGAIKGFAITLALGVAISMFTGLVVTRALAKLYLYINPDNAARARIKPNNEEQIEEPKPQQPVKRKLNMGGAK